MIRHTTLMGRVVYNRKPHLFTARDLARIARKIPAPGTLADRVSLLLVVWQIFLAQLQATLDFVPYYDRFGVFLPYIRQFIGDIWNRLTSSAPVPGGVTAAIIKQTELQGGLSRLDLY